MPRPITWWRIYRGKVWHVGWAGDAAACGKEPAGSPEAVGERAPVNARVCPDCVPAVRHLYAVVFAAEQGDPRKPFDPWAAGEALIVDDVVDAEIVCGDCGQVDHEGACLVGALRASFEAARARREATGEEWPCGSCGHPNLDHDIDDQSCTVTDDAFDAVAGEPLGPCDCRGLQPAV